MEFRDFALQTITSLAGTRSYKRARGEKRGPPVTEPVRDEVRFSRDCLHAPIFPDDGSKDHRCEVCEKKYKIEKKENPNKPYKEFVHKSVKTSIFCETCEVYLCVKRGSTCWTDYHTKVQYWRP